MVAVLPEGLHQAGSWAGRDLEDREAMCRVSHTINLIPPSVPGGTFATRQTYLTLPGKETALQKIKQYRKFEMCSVILTRFSVSVRANMYVLTLLFWWSNVYKRRVAWSDVCCSHRAVYRLLKLIWKVCGIDEGKGLLSGTEKPQNF